MKNLIKKYLRYVLPVLLPISIILLITDLLFRFYYWSGWSFTIRESTIFNNIITPIATIVSIIIYWITLKLLINQNKAARRQNIRTSFERDLADYEQQFSEVIVRDEVPKELGITKFNMYDKIDNMIYALYKNNAFLDDKERIKNNELNPLELSYRSYYPTILTIRSLGEITMPYYALLLLKNRIKYSDLEEIDRRYLIQNLDRKYLNPFLSFMKTQIDFPDSFMLPILKIEESHPSISLETFISTSLGAYYDVVLTATES